MTGRHSHKFDVLVRCINDDEAIAFMVVRCGCGEAIAIRKMLDGKWHEVDESDWEINPPDPVDAIEAGEIVAGAAAPVSYKEPATVRLARNLISSSWETITQSSEALKAAAEMALVADGYSVK